MPVLFRWAFGELKSPCWILGLRKLSMVLKQWKYVPGTKDVSKRWKLHSGIIWRWNCHNNLKNYVVLA